jgi:transcriptional antiterminator NusG
MINDKQTNWYTVKVRNNYEKIVSDRIVLEMNRLKKEIRTIIPKERVFSAKNGKKVFKEKILYPGYIFVETTNIGDLISVVRETTGATNILKTKEGKFITLKQSEVNKMVQEDVEIKAPVSDELYIIGESINILTGAFAEMNGKIDEVNMEKRKLKVLVSIFKKLTPVELNFDEVAKL